MTWRRLPLKRVATIRVSNVDKKTVEGEPQVRLCNYTDVYYRDSIDPSQEFMRATASPEQVSAFRLEPGDVVVTKDSESADDIGIPTYVERGAPDLVCGYHLALIRPRQNAVSGRFLYWTMTSSSTRRQLEVAATGITRFGLRADAIGGAEMEVPSLPVQRAIVGFLDAETARIDALIDKKQRLISLLRQRLAAFADRRIRDLLSASERVRLQRVVSEIDTRLGSDDPPQLLLVSIHEGVVPREEFTDRLARADELSAYKRCRPGDLILNRMRAFQGGVGRAPLPGIVSPDYSVIRPKDGIDDRYLHHVSRSRWFVGEMTSRLRGIGGSNQGNVRTPRINFADLKLIEIPLPPIGEQRRVADEIERASASIRLAAGKLEQQLDLIAEHRQALVTAAVTGQLEVPGVAA